MKYNDYIDYIAPTEEEKAREEMEKNEPVPIKTFEVKVRQITYTTGLYLITI